MSADPMYVQLTWEDPETHESQQKILIAPIAIGREKDRMPEQVGEQSIERLELPSKEISRFHALITVANQHLYITDQSANGTFLNGRRIPQSPQGFSTEDTLRIGPYKITATLMRENDLNATAQSAERTGIRGSAKSAQDNNLMILLIGGVVLLLMGVGAWLLVSNLLKNSRPEVDTIPEPASSVPLLKPVASVPPANYS
ncbi:FHA domain-containing protein [Lyngbya aestuarii]|uniref:FHA domain-containing protein n=1 Tax=Lyngbya aestuarii TaxID=118322 RepID=UPI00403DF384